MQNNIEYHKIIINTLLINHRIGKNIFTFSERNYKTACGDVLLGRSTFLNWASLGGG